MEKKTKFDLKELSLDVWERCIFWLCASWIVSNILGFLGCSWFFVFVTFSFLGCTAVIFVDRCVVDPNGKSVLITGCDTGFGFNTAKKLHSLGFTVFATVISADSGGAKELQNDGFKSRMHVIPMDVTLDEDVKKGIEFVKYNLPPQSTGLWAVITNAGCAAFGEVEIAPLDVYQKVMEVNLFGTIRVVRAALPYVRRAKGRVITVSSMMGRFGAPSRAPYAVSKWAVQGFSECLRAEMKRWDVNVSIIEPGNFVAGTSIFAGDAITKQAEHIWNSLPEDVRNDYGKEKFETEVKKMKEFTSSGVCDIEPVIKAFCDAVLHVYPQTRYQIMTPKEKIRCFLATHAPSILYDALYN